jgi:hypothetical protein
VVLGLEELLHHLWPGAAELNKLGSILCEPRCSFVANSFFGFGVARVRVNAIAAEWLDTEDISLNKSTEDLLTRFLPLRRWGHPKGLVPLVVNLAADACDFVPGTVVSVDGGAIAYG